MKYVYIFLLILAISACNKGIKDNQSEQVNLAQEALIEITKAQFTGEQMQLGQIEEQTFNESITTNGFIDVPPQNRASVSSYVGGYIKNTPLLIGDKVRKGQRLVTIQNTEFIEMQQEFVELTAQLNYLKSEFERQQTLYNEKITSQKNYLKAESTYKSTLAMQEGLRKKLEMLNINTADVLQGKIASSINIYAPIEGFITKINISNGSFVSPADMIMEIIDTDHVHLELAVFEKDVLKVKKGQRIIFTIPEASDEVFEAEVHLVGTAVNESDRTIKVHGHIKNDENTNFVTGMFVEAKIIASSKKSLALPKDATAESNGHFYALKLEDIKNDVYYFKKIILVVGEQSEDFVEVKNFKDFDNKEVLTKGAFMLINE
ncbi:MAG: efflux RND transporter periplasmic adaptor subunit [Aureibaculum sp.]